MRRLRPLFFIFIMIISLSANVQLAVKMISAGSGPEAGLSSRDQDGGRSPAMLTALGFQDVHGAVLKTRPLPSGGPGRTNSRTFDDYLPDSWSGAVLNHDQYSGHHWALALSGSNPHPYLSRLTAHQIIPPGPDFSLKVIDRLREYRTAAKEGWGENCNYSPAGDACPGPVFG